MEKINILTLIITLVVGVIMTGALLAPVTNDYSEATKTIENVGMPYTEAGGDHTIIVDVDGITFDGETVDMSKFPGNFQTYTLVYGEKSFVRWGATNVLTVSDSDVLRTFNVSSGNTVTITLSGTTVTVTTSASTQSFTANDVLYHISPSGGDYVLSLNPYVSEGDTVYAAGDTYFTTGGSVRPAPIRLWIVWTGEGDNITISANGFSGSGYDAVSVADPIVTLNNPTSNLYQYESIVFDWTATATVEGESTEYPLTSTYSYFLAPAEVTYDNPNYVAGGAGLISVIPIIVIVAILMVAVGAVAYRRAD